jgi:hypothetical protein
MRLVIVSSIGDILIISALAMRGIAMRPLSTALVASTLLASLLSADQSTRFPAIPDCVTPEPSLPGPVSVIDQTASIASLRLAWMAMCCFLSNTPPDVLHPRRNAHAATR